MLNIATKFAPHRPAFEIAWNSGFRHAEFWLDTELLQQVDAIITLAQEYPLHYVPHCPNRGLDEQSLRQLLQLYSALGSQALVVHQPVFDRWGELLQSELPGVRLAVENHRLSPSAFTDWAERNPGLNLDFEHVWKFTLPSADLPELWLFLQNFLRQYGHKVYHVHLPGYLPGQGEHRPMYTSREFVMMAWDLLQEIGYQGFIVSEVDDEFQTVFDLKMDLLLFDRWLKMQV